MDKPAGISSAEVVRRIKRRLGKTRVGHLGTLDPFATGLLPILLGEATKLAPFLLEGAKEYEGLIQLGAETDTLDPSGKVVRTAEIPIVDDRTLAALAARFTGVIEQTPPVFSALRRGGERLYKLARRDAGVAPPPARQVEISRLKIEPGAGATLRFSLTCGSGTYVRALARDIGLALDSAGYLSELRRTRNGIFSVAGARSLDDIAGLLEGGDAIAVTGMREALAGLAEIEVEPAVAARLRNGDSRALMGRVPALPGLFKIVADGRLLAIARSPSGITASLVRVFAD